MKYLHVSNDLSFTGIKVKTSGVEIVDKQSNYFHVWRLGNKMSLIYINKFIQAHRCIRLPRQEREL